eukprot:jgi/Tetstr1/444350/TSEL_032241.t1
MDLKGEFSYHQVGNTVSFAVPAIENTEGAGVRVRLTVVSPKDLARLDFVGDDGATVPIPDGVYLFTAEELSSGADPPTPSTPLGGPDAGFYVVSYRTKYFLQMHGNTVFALYEKAVQTPAVAKV